MSGRRQELHGTAAAWTSADSVLRAGEWGVETDTGKAKIGDGSTAWTSLPYFGGGASVLDDLTDVDTTGKADLDVVTWDAGTGTWIAAPAAGGAPTGSAGGELAGTFPNPTVAAMHSGSAHHTEDHDHDGSPTQKLAQANTHQSPDTDSGTTALHHTLGTGANQSAAGNHGHSGYAAVAAAIARNAAVAINDTNYVTLGSVGITCAAGDVWEIEAWGQVRNDNSGGARTYTYCIDFGGVLIEIADGNTIGQSTTSRAPFRIRGVVSVVSSSSVELDGWLDTGALVAAGTPGNEASGSVRALWNTSGSDVTGSITLAIKVKSSNASATQTGWLIKARALKVGA